MTLSGGQVDLVSTATRPIDELCGSWEKTPWGNMTYIFPDAYLMPQYTFSSKGETATIPFEMDSSSTELIATAPKISEHPCRMKPTMLNLQFQVMNNQEWSQQIGIIFWDENSNQGLSRKDFQSFDSLTKEQYSSCVRTSTTHINCVVHSKDKKYLVIQTAFDLEQILNLGQTIDFEYDLY
jgi:hypothetical protein